MKTLCLFKIAEVSGPLYFSEKANIELIQEQSFFYLVGRPCMFAGGNGDSLDCRNYYDSVQCFTETVS